MTPRSRKKKDGITPETSRRPKEEMEEARRVLEESSEENPNQENPTSQPADSSTTRPPATRKQGVPDLKAQWIEMHYGARNQKFDPSSVNLTGTA